MEKEEKVDRKRGGKTISKSGQGWTLPAQPGQLKAGQDEKGLLQSHLWRPNDHARLWDKVPEMKVAKFATSIDLDEVAHNEPPHLDLHCLPSSL